MRKIGPSKKGGLFFLLWEGGRVIGKGTVPANRLFWIIFCSVNDLFNLGSYTLFNVYQGLSWWMEGHDDLIIKCIENTSHPRNENSLLV